MCAIKTFVSPASVIAVKNRKKRKMQSLLDSTDHREIITASEILFCKMGKQDSATVVKELSEASSSKGTAAKKFVRDLALKPFSR